MWDPFKFLCGSMWDPSTDDPNQGWDGSQTLIQLRAGQTLMAARYPCYLMIRSSEFNQLWWLLIVTFRCYKWLHIAVGWQVSALYHNCGTTRCQGRSTVALPLTMITPALYGPCDDWHWLHGKVPQLSTVLGFWLQFRIWLTRRGISHVGQTQWLLAGSVLGTSLSFEAYS